MKIGDKIRDIEDGDCYYEGIIVELNPLRYKVTNILWCNEIDNSMNGEIIGLKWWQVELFKNNEWINVT
jgi:hypothetical protein|tara:strand:- start:74 stop:280 length:207 start_codon:yes stop_codon:yes gene_type:complete